MALDGTYNFAHTNSTGALPGHTGSPADGKTCATAGCHGATATVGTNMFLVGVPTAGYNPNQTYLVQVNFNGLNNKGFQISPQDAGGALQGMLINTVTSGSAGTQIVGSKYITHTLAQSGASGSWNFQWRAPAAGTGPVTFYGAFVNGRNSGLRTQAVTIQENPAASVANVNKLTAFKLYPNPVSDQLTISYVLERPEMVTIKVYDITGRESMVLVDKQQDSGQHNQRFDLKQRLSKGVYFVHVQAGNKAFSQKLLVR
jgi:hypothetical protein